MRMTEDYPMSPTRNGTLTQAEQSVAARYCAGKRADQIADEDGTDVGVVSRVLQRAHVRAYIDDVHATVRRSLADHGVRLATKALNVIEEVMDDKTARPGERLAAAAQILDRVLPKPPDVATQTNVNVTIGDVRAELQQAVSTLDNAALGLD